VASEQSSVSIVLFDEIEKAAPSMTRLLLGILDKATLRLGDNNVVNFERSLIFLTSNLGARSMMKELNPQFGLGGAVGVTPGDKKEKLESIAMNAVRRQFSPEFVNRVDAVVTYQPLGAETLRTILDQQLTELQAHIRTRLGERSFDIEVPNRARLFLLEHGTSLESGAREIKRTLHRHLTQPLSALVAEDKIKPGERVVADLNSAKDKLRLKIAA
jgi:ATP-dependent Clp protease ATP-binding subunit ClpA